MTRFEATNHSTEVVDAERDEIWDVLTDPDTLVELTPLLRDIDTDDHTWTWHLVGIEALGVRLVPSFTESMSFDPGRRIDFTHAPQGADERAGADGRYLLSDDGAGTHLDIEITLHVELPLPRAARGAVEAVMRRMMQTTGDRFGRNLHQHLGLGGA